VKQLTMMPTVLAAFFSLLRLRSCEMMCSLAKRAAICSDRRRSPPAPSPSNNPRKLLFRFSFFGAPPSAVGVSLLPLTPAASASSRELCFEPFFLREKSRDDFRFFFLSDVLRSRRSLDVDASCSMVSSSPVHDGVAVMTIFGTGRDCSSGLADDAVTTAPRRNDAAWLPAATLRLLAWIMSAEGRGSSSDRQPLE